MAGVEVTELDSARERARFKALVDALPEPEGDILTALWWGDASLREIARQYGWIKPSGEPDATKVSRIQAEAFKRLRTLAELVDLDLDLATCSN